MHPSDRFWRRKKKQTIFGTWEQKLFSSIDLEPFQSQNIILPDLMTKPRVTSGCDLKHAETANIRRLLILGAEMARADCLFSSFY